MSSLSSLDEARVQGVRELRQALIKGAALVPEPEVLHTSAGRSPAPCGKAAPTRMAMITADRAAGRRWARTRRYLPGELTSIYAACMRSRETLLTSTRRSRSETESLVVLLSAWLYQATAQSRDPSFQPTKKGRPVNVSRAFLLSGAQGLLLSPWRRPARGGVSVNALAVETSRRGASQLLHRSGRDRDSAIRERWQCAYRVVDRGA